ncbi:hypothetical protein RP20_CCG007466 [Aedes albopictus]|nr:hypothetical protein RP20_CCG007466 [Aedes albopictus]
MGPRAPSGTWKGVDETNGSTRSAERFLEEKNATRAVMQQLQTRQNAERYKQKWKQQNRLFLRGSSTRCLMHPVTTSCRESKYAGIRRPLEVGRDVIKRWKQHFDEHFNGVEDVSTKERDKGGNDYANAAEDGNELTPTLREVKDAIHQLKPNKAAGKDGIAAELTKMGPEKLATCLHRLVVRIWESKQLPDEWKEGVICPIHKKGDHLECENLRAITILNAAYDAERMNRTIVEKARSMLCDVNLEKCYWAEAVATASYVINRSPTKGLLVTPEEAFTGRRPNLAHLRVFGSKVMFHVPKEKRNKWDPKSEPGIFMGYNSSSKAYRVYSPKVRNVIVSRDVIFLDENVINLES